MFKTPKKIKNDGYLADNESYSKKDLLKNVAISVTELTVAFEQKAKVSTLQDAINAFSIHLSNISNNRISHNLPEINRRLDSLARLLEQGSVCAAVYYSPEMNAILVATNTIHAGSQKTNNWIKQIENVFKLISQCHLDIEQLIDVLSDTILIHIKHEERFLWAAHKDHPDFANPKDYIEELLKELFKSGLATKSWRDLYLKDINRNDDFSRTSLYEKTIRRTSRITRDFLKLRDSLHLSEAEAGSEAALFFSALKSNKFFLLKEGGKDLHAEMRLTTHVKRKNHKKANFGISKLCCACCNLGLYSVTADNIHAITTRGQHGQYYGWIMPDFIKENATLLERFLGNEAYEIYRNLTPQDQNKLLKAIEDKKLPIKKSKIDKAMVADSSGSDIEFGLSCESGDELEAVAFDQKLQDIPQLRELTRNYSEAYTNLIDAGASPDKVFSIFQESPEKLEALGHKNSVSLIASNRDEDVLSELDELFEKNKSLFRQFIDDEDNAIENFGYKQTLEALWQEIPSNSEDEGDEDDIYSDNQPYRRAGARLLDENTWQYEQNSEGEWGYPDSGEDSEYHEVQSDVETENSDSYQSDDSSNYSFRR